MRNILEQQIPVEFTLDYYRYGNTKVMPKNDHVCIMSDCRKPMYVYRNKKNKCYLLCRDCRNAMANLMRSIKNGRV